jgi:hypothetical protein
VNVYTIEVSTKSQITVTVSATSEDEATLKAVEMADGVFAHIADDWGDMDLQFLADRAFGVNVVDVQRP